ncbi:MAG: carboxylesterase family protein [Saccharofermentans sp.]|nr:carboxylesterase family protein [Saccharofermentans sp.]
MDIVQTNIGKVRGKLINGVMRFTGIPFAEPPVGDLAFKHPVPKKPWDGVLDCLTGSSNPMQGPGHKVCDYRSRDCLYMNIFIPQSGRDSYPVTVWIYGGSYTNGGVGRDGEDPDQLVYDLSRIAKETDTIAVGFNYRVNLYGFLNLHFLDPDYDMNNGIYDQIAALKFLKENIESFGGDADNITLYGQSAGAASILALMGMEEAKPYFNKAISMSAFARSFWTEEESEKLTRYYLKCVHVKPGELDKLKQLPADVIKKAGQQLKTHVYAKRDLRCAFSPVIDGKTIKGEPYKLCQTSDKPLIISTCWHEADIFTSDIPTFLLPAAARFFGLKPGKREGRRERLSDEVSEMLYKGPAKEIRENYRGNVWVYEYRYMTPEIRAGLNRCFHSSDVAVLLGIDTVFTGTNDPETDEMGMRLRKIWSDFAWNSDPGWNRYSDDKTIKIIE